jgi:hypothetical protein
MNYQTSQGENYPLDNLTFDLIAIIYEKSKAIEAYEKYLVDARGDQTISDLLDRMRKMDEDCVVEIQRHLGRLLTKPTSRSEKQAGA